MRIASEVPFRVRDVEFGGSKPLICVPLVANDLDQLLSQAETACRFDADIIEWRADSFGDATSDGLVNALQCLRKILVDRPLIFTLRILCEGGAKEISQQDRLSLIQAVAASCNSDMIDLEICNGDPFIATVMGTAKKHGVRVILSFHDFHKTPSSDELLAKIESMNRRGADVAKIAVMPQHAQDVLRLLETTLEARKRFPRLSLCTISMGKLGSLTRTAGALFGSDMTFAVATATSAPGQIQIGEARAITEKLMQFSGC
jgi:3-dehydroquinate dehydratase-1